MFSILRTSGALTLLAASCVARLPMGALGLLLVLSTRHRTGSYAAGGLAAAAYALLVAVSDPVQARLVDRRGQTLVLRAGAAVAAAGLVALALLPRAAPLWAIVACAAVIGLGQPPVGACMRALWPTLLRGGDDRHAAYAMESAVLEIVYICGPLLLVAGLASWSTSAALGVCAGLMLAGDLAFSAHPISRGWRPTDPLARASVGPLGDRAVRVLVAVFALCGLAAGAVEVTVPAALEGMGHRGLTGVLLGVWGIGSMLAGLTIGHLGAPVAPARRLTVALMAWGAAHALLGLAGAPLSLALLLLLAGATIAPTFVYANGMLDALAPPGTLTEAFTWTGTGIMVGAAGGSAMAGVLVEASSPGVAMAVLGSGGLLAAALVRLAIRGPLSGEPVAPVEPATV
jgi:MFS family permease